MRVLHVIPSLSRTEGGPTQALQAMEQALAARGIETETAATDDAGPPGRNGKPCGVPVIDGEGDHTRWYFRKRTGFYKAAPSFVPWLRANVRRFDLVHIHALFSFLPAIAARTCFACGVPYVLRPLGTLNAYGLAQRRPLLKKASLRWIERAALERASAVHFTSHAEALEARALGYAITEAVIPLGVPLAAIGPPAHRGNREQVVALYLSRLDPKKNVEALLEAFACVADDSPQLVLRIAGGGDSDYVSAIHRRGAALGLGGRVHWLGHVSGEAKAQALAEADFFVLASHSENFGIAAAEALAGGLPCVLGEGVAIASEVEAAGAGVVVRPEPAPLEAALRLMLDPVRRVAMSRNAVRIARDKFSMHAMGAGLEALYTKILRGRDGFPAGH